MSNIYIIGHKSPDLDSVAAAIAYANFKNKSEKTDKYIPVIAGEINRETKYVLERFNISQPEILGDAVGKEVILVDHNEFSQAIDGIESAKILGVLDHHKVDFKYSEPIDFYIRMWGATCTILAKMYMDSDVDLNSDLAGLLLSAILVDTVITKSPTSTSIDLEVIEKLAQIAPIGNWREYGMELFRIRSSVSELSDIEIIQSDFKDFYLGEEKIGIGQVETADLGEFKNREDNLLSELVKIKEDGYHTVMLFLTDIINEGSQFLVVSDDNNKFERAFDVRLSDSRVYIPGILSRKKQVVPKLTDVFLAK